MIDSAVHTMAIAGARLARLPRNWQLLAPTGDDHVVVTLTGVFTVVALHRPGAKVWVRGDVFKVNGLSQHYVGDARRQAARVSTLLSAAAGFEVDVHAVIAVTGETEFAVREQPRDVTVADGRTLTLYLHSLPVVLDQPSIARINAVARVEETWDERRYASALLK